VLLSFEYMPYIAIIGDIVDSRKQKDRKRIQERLSSLLHDINAEYSDVIASKFMITLGDEFQGLMYNGAHAVEIVDKIERVMHPVGIRFGIGVGKITTEINSNIPLGADGPAYYNARNMIDDLKSIEKKKMEAKINMKIKIEDNSELSELINTIFSLNTVLKAKWTDRQREIIDTYLKCNGTQSDAARELGINQSNVQKALSNSDFYAYQKSINTVTKILSYIKGA